MGLLVSTVRGNGGSLLQHAAALTQAAQGNIDARSQPREGWLPPQNPDAV